MAMPSYEQICVALTAGKWIEVIRRPYGGAVTASQDNKPISQEVVSRMRRELKIKLKRKFSRPVDGLRATVEHWGPAES